MKVRATGDLRAHPRGVGHRPAPPLFQNLLIGVRCGKSHVDSGSGGNARRRAVCQGSRDGSWREKNKPRHRRGSLISFGKFEIELPVSQSVSSRSHRAHHTPQSVIQFRRGPPALTTPSRLKGRLRSPRSTIADRRKQAENNQCLHSNLSAITSQKGPTVVRTRTESPRSLMK